MLSALLQEDRSKPGYVVVRFTTDRALLNKINLWVTEPGPSHGLIYDLWIKDFIERKKDR
ncbi:MAG: hypothetical protein EXR99_13505 [Gemmataceae bacterium]|nr:hypothetical protein [Gemmataceae bacterium]